MLRGKRLLILDDDPLIGQTIRHIAEFAHCEVQVTSSPADFFEVLSGWVPDFIALDLVMPEMDGVEVMAELARRQCRSRIIITSGVGHRILDAAGRSASEHGLNIAGVLAKPFSPTSLRSLLLDDDGERPEMPSLAPVKEKRPEEGRAFTAADLERAIDARELFVVYQPKVICATGELAGFEALVRWRHPQHGLVTPDHFVPLAESSGLIDRLTMQVADTALRWFSNFCSGAGAQQTLRPQERGRLTLSLNISALSLNNSTLFEHMNTLCQKAGINPQRIIFELTETSAMDDPISSLDLLTRLRMRGFRLSIDDFGTGFSSMLQLVRLPFSEMKVDKSFVATARQSAESRAVIRSISDLGRSLGLQITAEGIEDEETLHYLRRIGCDHVQGYFLARPMEAPVVLDWLHQRAQGLEESRVAALQALQLRDTTRDARLERLVALARRLFRVPMAAFSLLDSDLLWFKTRSGFDCEELPRQYSFCAYTVETGDTFVVPDALADPRFNVLPLVRENPRVRFYAGHPVAGEDGGPLGSLCLMDHQPRLLSKDEQAALTDLARWLEAELGRNRRAAQRLEDGLASSELAFNGEAERVLALCERLRLPSAQLHFDLAADGAGEPDPHRHRAFLGLLRDSLQLGDFIGRVAEHRYTVLLPGAGERERSAAERRVREALLRHNASTLRDLELQVSLRSNLAGETLGA